MNRRFFLKLLGLGTAASVIPSAAVPAAAAIRPVIDPAFADNPVIQAKLAAASEGWICSGWVGRGAPRYRRDLRGRFARRSTDTNGTE